MLVVTLLLSLMVCIWGTGHVGPVVRRCSLLAA